MTVRKHDAIEDAVAALEDVVNGHGIASWDDVEEFFTDAAFEITWDLQLGQYPDGWKEEGGR